MSLQGSELEDTLKMLQKKLERGAITDGKYQQEKKRVLEDFVRKK